MKTLALSALVFVAPSLALAQIVVPIPGADAPSFRVYVSHNGTDSVGQQFVYAAKEELRRSSSYPLTLNIEDAELVLIVSSMDPLALRDAQVAATTDNTMTAVGIVVTYVDIRPEFINSTQLLVGRNRTEEMSKSLVAWFDASITDWRTQNAKDNAPSVGITKYRISELR